MISTLTIINLALNEIGKNTIGSLSENSPQARQASLILESCIKATLEDYNWSFARKVSQLNTTDEDSLPDWDYAYILPSDFVAARKVYSATVATTESYWGSDGTTVSYDYDEQEYKIYKSSNGNYLVLYSNAEDAYLEYTSYTTDASIFSAGFVEALKYKLAHQLAPASTGDKQIRQDMLQMYSLAIEAARSKNSNSRHEKTSITNQSPFYDCRD